MKRIALTGGIATGKTYVANRLAVAGIPVVDADALAREAVALGTPGLAAIVGRYGAGMLNADGTLDRARLGELVFRDGAARRDLEAIVHPLVRRGIDHFFHSLPEASTYAVADIPLLYESGRQHDFDAVIVVTCSSETQSGRLIARDGLSVVDAERRLAAQWPIDRKVALADFVVSSEGSFADTDAEVATLLAWLEAASTP